MLKKLKEKFVEIDSDLRLEERSNEIYGVTAVFETPDSVIEAAKKVADSGYENWDVNTPFPIHGMDDAMKLKPTKLGYATFTFGTIGALSALAMIAYMSGFDYKNIIGGKPFFALPPSIPITFELTILLAALFTIIFTLIVFNKLPKINHPLMDTEYMRRVSSEAFGIFISAEDKKFNPDEIIGLLKSLGSSSVSLVYKFTNDEGKIQMPIFKPGFLGILAGTAIVTAIATYIILNFVIYTAPFDWMTNQPKLNPQKMSTLFADGFGMRTPVEGTVARGFKPYESYGKPDSLIKIISNPMPFTKEVFELGKKKYDTYCSPCHGNYGKGDSRLNGQFPNPPTLHSDKVRNWKDANIYHVIVNGQNIMPSYAKQINDNERWAIVHYIRALQRSQNALDSDIPVEGNKK